jgi:hypothetical protein
MWKELVFLRDRNGRDVINEDKATHGSDWDVLSVEGEVEGVGVLVLLLLVHTDRHEVHGARLLGLVAHGELLKGNGRHVVGLRIQELLR